MFSMLMGGMPNKACLFPRSTKDLQIFHLLCCNFTLPICVIVVLLYVFNFMPLFLVDANCSFVPLGNNFYTCIKALCFHQCLCLLYMVLLLKLDVMIVFRFAVITNCLLLK